MSYATGTTHYNLPQTVGTDKRDWTDTNEAFSAVDTALYGAVQDAETATSGIQTLNTAVDTINGKLATDEGNISTLSGKVSTLESTVSGHTSAIADVRSDLQDNIEAHKEASATSAHAYSIGDTFYYNDILYKATANIGVGDTIVPNTNCTGITVMSEIQSQTAPTAAQVSYDGTASGLTADDVQEAIDELTPKSVSVNYTTSNTYKAVFDALAAVVDFTKIKAGSTITIQGETKTIIQFTRNDGVENYIFEYYSRSGSTSISGFQVLLKVASSTATSVIISSGVTSTDISATNMPENGTIILTY